MDTRLTELLGTQYPIILAPMAGISTAELTSAACNAGALGSIPVGARDPDGARADIEAVRSATNRPFNVNLFVHQPPARDTAKESAWLQPLEPLFQELGASPPSALGVPYQTLAGNDAMLRLLCELRPAVVSVHFGLPERTVIQTLKGLGIVLMASATPAAEAEAIEAAGIDIVIAQGYEAGGHRGTFNPSFDEGQIGTFALVRQVAGAVRIPVGSPPGVLPMDAVSPPRWPSVRRACRSALLSSVARSLPRTPPSGPCCKGHAPQKPKLPRPFPDDRRAP